MTENKDVMQITLDLKKKLDADIEEDISNALRTAYLKKTTRPSQGK